MGGWWGRVRIEGRGLEWEAGRGLGRKVDGSPRPERPPSLLQSPSPSTLPAASPAIATVLAAVLAAADAGECDWAIEKPSSASPAVSQTHHGYFSGCLFATHSPFPPACFPGCVFPPPAPPSRGRGD